MNPSTIVPLAATVRVVPYFEGFIVGRHFPLSTPIKVMALERQCIVPKSLTLNTHELLMGKHNKAIKLTRRKIRHIIRNKINNNSTKRIAAEMKVSISTVKRVWMYWLKNREAVPINKSGKKKKELDDDNRSQIIKIHKKQKLGARRLEKVLEFKYNKHVPHNAIHRFLLEEGLAEENKKKKKLRKPLD